MCKSFTRQMLSGLWDWGLLPQCSPSTLRQMLKQRIVYWGQRAALSYNARVQIDQGAQVAFGSDSPIEPFEPFLGIYAAVTRQRPDGSLGADGWHPDAKLTVDEAIRGYTRGAAYAVGTEDRQGWLGLNTYADLIVLDQNPYVIEPDALLDVTVLGTMVDGDWRYGGV
jgi:predicted amidohydrolase YtcJ